MCNWSSLEVWDDGSLLRQRKHGFSLIHNDGGDSSGGGADIGITEKMITEMTLCIYELWIDRYTRWPGDSCQSHLVIKMCLRWFKRNKLEIECIFMIKAPFAMMVGVTNENEKAWNGDKQYVLQENKRLSKRMNTLSTCKRTDFM